MSFPVSRAKAIKIKKNRGAQLEAFRPQLTSLIDIMVLLIVFLIKNFSMEGSAATIPRDVTLPVSSAKKAPKAMVTIAVNNNVLVVEGEPLANVSQILKDEDLMIVPVYNWLSQRKDLTEQIAKYSKKNGIQGRGINTG